MAAPPYAHKPLSPFRRTLARFSLSELAKYTKLTLGLWLAFGIAHLFGYPDAAVSLAGSTMLTLALGSSISAARGYFHKRVMSNLVAMPIGTLLIWLTAPHLWLGVILLPLVIFTIVGIKPSVFQMTSITVPMTLVLYTGEHIPLLEQRLVAVVLGMLLGFILQQIAFPPDHGFWANTLVIDGNDQSTAVLSEVASGVADPARLKKAAATLRRTSGDLKQAHDLLKSDLEQSWVSAHLERNRDRLPLFLCYHELFDSIVGFLETLDGFNAQFEALDGQWKDAYKQRLARLVGVHQQLAAQANLRTESPRLLATPLALDALHTLLEALPATGVYMSVYLGHLSGYGILLSRLSDMHSAHLRQP
jgi:hypothetical protein